jgi:glycosyltransferase involved in cell wall biosynthesis
VLPSLEDNLPNTIMEAMACGVPCVGFKTGGIPEEIDHKKTGYVAQQRDAADLAQGIRWVLDEADRDALRQASVRKVNTTYAQNAVSLRYIEVYNEALAFKHYSI